MTKFEEEAIKEAQKSKVIAKCYDGESTASDIGLNIKLGRATHNFPWLEFAKNWHSDEEFQEIMEIGGKVALANKNLIDVNTKLAEEIANLKSQLQQQALPVVPKCVGKYIEDCKKEGDCLFGVFADATRVEHDMPDLVYFWLGDEGNNDELFARAWLDGYTVEKPQLFYLKNKLTGAYLYYDEATKLYSDIVGNVEDFFGTKTKFTKAEIDSMETGSYEQIEVAE